MTGTIDLTSVYARLKPLLERFAAELWVTADTEGNYSLDVPTSGKKAMFFGAVQVKKNYVSYYLMPVYVHPELLQDMSESLRRRMQGKSCFNFSRIDEANIAELSELTQKGFDAFREDGLL